MSEGNRILVVGASSGIGRSLMAYGTTVGQDMVGTSRLGDPLLALNFFDLTANSATILLRDEPTHAILLAGRTSIADCERNPEATRAVNVEGVFAAAKVLAEEGISVTVVSSSSVFSRNRYLPLPGDATDPACEYGRQKAELEKRCLQLDSVVIVRLTKVLNGASVLDAWVEALSQGQPIVPFSNVAVAPLRVVSVVTGLLEVTLTARDPIVHLSPCDDITYAQMADALARWLNVDSRLVEPVTTETDPLLGLLTGPFAALGQPWSEGADESSMSAVERFLAERFGQS